MTGGRTLANNEVQRFFTTTGRRCSARLRFMLASLRVVLESQVSVAS
jgi:hypothetical protein